MKLILPCEAYAGQIAAYRQEFLDAGSSMDGTGFLRRMADPLEWIACCRSLADPDTVPDGLVQATQFMAVREEDGRVVGMIDVRHRLNEFLAQWGGHIGYSVRPGERGKGYAAQMLRLALIYAFDELKLPRVLVTCAEGNERSRRTILRCGGAYDGTVLEPGERERIQRYWIAPPETLLVTGFSPFGGQRVNPSWEAAALLPDWIGKWRIRKLRLPVVFGEAGERAIREAEACGARAVLSVGQAAGRDAVTPEMVAVNLRYAASPDQSGAKPEDTPVCAEGPAAYFAALPARKMAGAIDATGIPCRVSLSAGTYVCNDVFYQLLRHFDGSEVRCGFVHVPYCEGQGEPCLPLARIARALQTAIEAI